MNTNRKYLLSLLLLMLSGCFASNSLFGQNGVESIGVYVAPNSELKYAVSIDVVFVYSEDLASRLADINGETWFQQKSAIISSYSSQLDLLEWQIVNGYADESRILPKGHRKAIKVLAFMYYPGSEQTRVDITNTSAPWLVVESKRLEVKLDSPSIP